MKSGAAYVILGHAGAFAASFDLAGLDGGNGFKIVGAAATDFVGFSTSGARDFNGDGFDDLIIGAHDSAYVVLGGTGPFTTPLSIAAITGAKGFKIQSENAAESFGGEVSGVGDVNGDGFDDVIVSAYYATVGGHIGAGKAYVIFGHAGTVASPLLVANLDGNDGFKLIGEAVDQGRLRSVAGAGDVNGDGFADLILGAYRAGGKAYVVFGRAGGFPEEMELSTLDGQNGIEFAAELAGDTGRSVSGAGDVNGDGYDDVLIGFPSPNAPLAPGQNAGISYVFYGGPSGEFIDPTFSTDAKTATWTDVDGDLVTLKFSAGSDTLLNAGTFKLLAKSTTDSRAQLLALNLGSAFEGQDMSITAKRMPGGDGKVNAGAINASFLDLGKVTIGGDLGQIEVGDGDAVPAFKSLSVGSLGVFGGRTQDTGGDLVSQILGPAGAVKVLGDIKDAQLSIQTAGSPAALASLTVGGSLIGGKRAVSGVVNAATFGPVIIADDFIGGAGQQSGYLEANSLTSLTIGGDARGGDADFSGGILAGGTLGPVVVKGDVIGTAGHAYTIRGSGALTGAKSVAITSLKVGGDFDHALVLAGYVNNNVPANGHAQIGAISIGGDWIASSVTAGLLPFLGALNATGVFGNGDDVFINLGPNVIASIASITIKGRAVGTLETGDRFGIVAEHIGAVTIGGVKQLLTGNPDVIALGPTPDFFLREVLR